MPTSGPTSSLRIALVGAGRVGTAVTELLRRRGHIVAGVASRSAASARRSAELLGAPEFDVESELPAADLVLLGVPQGAIEAVAAQVAPRLGARSVVAHFAGSIGIAPLRPALDEGAGAVALHPVQACPDVNTAIERIPGSAWGVTASDGLTGWASDLVARDLEGLAVRVREGQRPLWHAASVIASNGIAALLATGEEMLRSIGVESPERVLGPLAAGAVANARAGGGGAATLTGPVVRGEDGIVAGHVYHIGASAPGLSDDYARVTRVVISAASRARRIDDETAAHMIKLLREIRP